MLQRELLALISEVIPAAQGASCCTGLTMRTRAAVYLESRWTASQGDGDSAGARAAGDLGTLRCVHGGRGCIDEHVLCVPLAAVERTLGVIYLSSPASSPPLKEEHAYFLSSVSRIAAVTLENLFKLDSLRAENERLRVEVKADATLIGESGRWRR